MAIYKFSGSKTQVYFLFIVYALYMEECSCAGAHMWRPEEDAAALSRHSPLILLRWGSLLEPGACVFLARLDPWGQRCVWDSWLLTSVLGSEL